MSGYIGNGPGRGQRQAFSFTATASQTAFSGVDSVGLTLTYKPRFIDVFVNGLCIPPSEYTATDGSTITFGFGLNAGDVVYVVAMSAFDVANTLAKDQNGADIEDKVAFRSNLNVGLIVPKGHIFGLTLSNNTTDATNDIDIAAGEAADADGNLMMLASAITKRVDASWVVGSGNGGLDTGSVSTGWYHIWLIQRSDTGVVDALFSTSATSPTMPTDYDRKRRIGAMRFSGGFYAFNQSGDDFTLTTSQTDLNSIALGTTAQTVVLSVPKGVKVLARFRALAYHNSTFRAVIFRSFEELAQNPVAGQFGDLQNSVAGLAVMGNFERITDTDGQIAAISNGADTTCRINTYGWVDTRGRLG